MAEKYVIDGELHIYETADEKHHMKKSVTLNGTYNADDEEGDITGYSEVVVNVPGGGSATLIEKSITENGTYRASSDSADGYSKVTVDVPIPPTPEPPTLIEKSVNQNGVYIADNDSADGYSKVTVNVPSSGGVSYETEITSYDIEDHISGVAETTFIGTFSFEAMAQEVAQ